MNDFDKYLLDNSIEVDPDKFYYNSPIYFNEERLFDCFNDILLNNRKVMIFGDCDLDGILSAYQVKEMFKSFSFSNYEVWNINNKNHSIDEDCIRRCIVDKFDYLIILDVGSNEMGKLEKLHVFGVKTIIIDHHVSNFSYDDYPSSCVIINTKMNNLVDTKYNYVLSAGALTFTLLYKYGAIKSKDLVHLSVCGLITLYSDSVDMDTSLAKSIYSLAIKLGVSSLPYFVKDFLDKYSFRRRFIEFIFSPRINSLFRSERFDIINKYFFDDSVTSIQRRTLINKIDEIYVNSRKLIARVSDTVPREELDNFVLCNLSKSDLAINTNKLYNYTGIIANNLADTYGKPCVVLCDTGNGIKGSFRDLFGRDYLSLFTQFCKCGGHPPAFGIHLKYGEVSDFLDTIKYTIDKRFYMYEIKENLIVEMDDKYPSVRTLEKMALYNEFAGISLSPVVIKKRHFMKELASYSKTYYSYSWGELKVDSNHKLVLGKDVYIKPIISSKLRLVTVNRVK